MDSLPVRARRIRRPRRLAPVAFAIAGTAVLIGGPGGPAPGDAVDPYRAGEPATVRSVLPAGAAARVRDRGLARARLIGVPVGTHTQVSRVHDRFSGTLVDELITTDARGRRLGIVRMDGDGRVTMAVRLGWQAPAGRRIDASAARSRATSLAKASGIAGGGAPTVDAAPDGGWRVAWARVVGGVPVVGDGSVVTLFGDGTLHAAARRERPLAATPPTTLTAPAVERIARQRLATLLGPAIGDARIERQRLAWIAPNDTFDPKAPDAPDPVLRLAWVVEVRTAGSLADRLRALELYLDAGDGALLGGDLLR
jgi:hypothetical protein